MKNTTVVLRATILVAILMAVMFVPPGQAYRPGETEPPERVPKEPASLTAPPRTREKSRDVPKPGPRLPSPEEQLRRARNPDLVIRIDSVGTPTTESLMGGEIINVAIPITFTVRNIGGAPATGDIAIMPWTSNMHRSDRGYSIMFSAPGADG